MAGLLVADRARAESQGDDLMNFARSGGLGDGVEVGLDDRSFG